MDVCRKVEGIIDGPCRGCLEAQITAGIIGGRRSCRTGCLSSTIEIGLLLLLWYHASLASVASVISVSVGIAIEWLKLLAGKVPGMGMSELGSKLSGMAVM